MPYTFAIESDTSNGKNEKEVDTKMFTVEDVNQTRLAFYQPLLAEDVLQFRIHGEEKQSIYSGVHFNGQPVGIAIATIKKDGDVAELIYIYVRKKFRRFGIGSSLIQHLEQRLNVASCTMYSTSFVRGINGSDGLEKFFSKNEYHLAGTDMFIFNMTLQEQYLALPWMKNIQLPRHFTIFPWGELTDQDRMDILAGKNDWYPATLDPLQYKEKIERDTSLGLKYKNDIIGWLITYYTASNKLEYANLFTKHHFQTRGRGIALMMKAMELQLQKRPEDQQLYFRVAADNQRMLTFLEKRVEPFVAMERQERIKMVKHLNK